MVGEWDFTGYPKEYVNAFRQDDSVVVERVASYLRDQDTVNRIVFVADKVGARVYGLKHTDRAASISQINWADPKKSPGSYQGQGYASTFHEFYGPIDRQRNRAWLLALELGVPMDELEISGSKPHPRTREILLEIARMHNLRRLASPANPQTALVETTPPTFQSLAGALLANSVNRGNPIEIPSLGFAFVKLVK